jgi:transposase
VPANNGLYDPVRTQGAIAPALCWAHARRKFFELADIASHARRGKNAKAISPIALEAVKRIDALFDIERTINGASAGERLRVRQERSAPLLAALESWLSRPGRAEQAENFAAGDRKAYLLDGRLGSGPDSGKRDSRH